MYMPPIDSKMRAEIRRFFGIWNNRSKHLCIPYAEPVQVDGEWGGRITGEEGVWGGRVDFLVFKVVRLCSGNNYRIIARDQFGRTVDTGYTEGRSRFLLR